ncbi:MAG: hypothetical protein ABS41_06450 [Arenimonas sp. SCN 70-307]|nr:MAG: hypothetical protein ABS41_06450 [Arenimonas sp. SCN 70-307]
MSSRRFCISRLEKLPPSTVDASCSGTLSGCVARTAGRPMRTVDCTLPSRRSRVRVGTAPLRAIARSAGGAPVACQSPKWRRASSSACAGSMRPAITSRALSGRRRRACSATRRSRSTAAMPGSVAWVRA